MPIARRRVGGLDVSHRGVAKGSVACLRERERKSQRLDAADACPAPLACSWVRRMIALEVPECLGDIGVVFRSWNRAARRRKQGETRADRREAQELRPNRAA